MKETITQGERKITIDAQSGKFTYECQCGEASNEAANSKDEIMMDAFGHTCKETS